MVHRSIVQSMKRESNEQEHIREKRDLGVSIDADHYLEKNILRLVQHYFIKIISNNYFYISIVLDKIINCKKVCWIKEVEDKLSMKLTLILNLQSQVLDLICRRV